MLELPEVREKAGQLIALMAVVAFICSVDRAAMRCVRWMVRVSTAVSSQACHSARPPPWTQHIDHPDDCRARGVRSGQHQGGDLVQLLCRLHRDQPAGRLSGFENVLQGAVARCSPENAASDGGGGVFRTGPPSSPQNMLATGVAVWSVFTVLTPMAARTGNLGLLLSCRLLMGLGEGITYPTIQENVARYADEERSKLVAAAADSSVGHLAGGSPRSGGHEPWPPATRARRRAQLPPC